MPKSSFLKFCFYSFTLAQLVSIFGDRLHQFSVVGMIGRIAPGSSIELLQFALFNHLPILFFAPVFGTLIDRSHKVLVLVVVDITRAAIVFAVPTLYLLVGNLYAFYVPVFFLALANLFFSPAKSALIPEIFGAPHLLKINSVLWGLGIVATIAGFLLGGWLFDYHSWTWSFYADGTSYVISFVFLLPLLFLPRYASAPRRAAPAEGGAAYAWYSGVGRFMSSIVDGLKLIKEDSRIAAGLTIQSSLFAILGMLYILGIARIQEIFPAEKTIYLSVIGSSATVGLLLGSLLAVPMRGRHTSIRLIAHATILMGAALIGVATADTLPTMAIWAAVAGFAFSPSIIISETVLQEHSPQSHRGRIFSTREILIKTTFLGASAAATVGSAFLDKAFIIVAIGLFLAVTGLILERKRFPNM